MSSSPARSPQERWELSVKGRLSACLLAILLAGCLFGGGRPPVDLVRVDPSQPPLRTYVSSTWSADISAELIQSLSRHWAATNRFGPVEIVSAAELPPLLTQPSTWQGAGPVIVIQTTPLRINRAHSTRIPYIWSRVAPTAVASAVVTVYSDQSLVLLPGAMVTGTGRGTWQHRLLSSTPPYRPSVLERRRMQVEAVTQLAESISAELGRFATGDTASVNGDSP